MQILIELTKRRINPKTIYILLPDLNIMKKIVDKIPLDKFRLVNDIILFLLGNKLLVFPL